MAFDFSPPQGDDRGHHKKTHADATHKLNDEVHGLLDRIHHGLQKAKPHIDHAANNVAHVVEHNAKSLGNSAKRELNGTATPEDKHKLETVGKVAATVLLPHVVIGGAIAKEGIKVIKEAGKHSNTHIHVDVHSSQHTTVKHGGSKS
ncbi:MAG TPA: hypothetical protein V6C89_18870 [Drouetiella sp.]|jgi:hypothetical protein